MKIDNPEDAVGKYVSYQGEEGAVWARISKCGKSRGEYVLITDFMKVTDSSGAENKFWWFKDADDSRVSSRTRVREIVGERLLWWNKIQNAEFWDFESLSPECADEIFMIVLEQDLNAGDWKELARSDMIRFLKKHHDVE
jgi:hypothetical protein